MSGIIGMILFSILIFLKMVQLVSDPKIKWRASSRWSSLYYPTRISDDMTKKTPHFISHSLPTFFVNNFLVTTCDESKCSIFSAYDMSYQDITLPTLEEGQKIEKVFHGRGKSSHLLAVKHSEGFFIW